MKFLISSNGPNTLTGYGVQCAHLATRLAAEGHQVAVACTWGHQVGIGQWATPNGDQIRLYWQGETSTSDDILAAHASHWFEGDPLGGWIILINDVWAFRDSAIQDLQDFNLIAWAPVDHVIPPPAVVGFLRKTGAQLLAMSKHAESAFLEAGLDPVHIPLSVDTTVFKPTYTMPTARGDIDSRTYNKIPPNAFVVGMVAMNKGWVFDRKGFSEAVYAFAMFHRLHPDSVLYLHTDPLGYDGLHLKAVAQSAGLPQEAIIWSQQWAYRHGFTSQMMAALYTSFDVLLAPSHGEGFCVPMIEAQACGTPVIASNATAQRELIGAGWGVDGQPVWDQSQLCPAFMPSLTDLVAKLETAYTADLPMMEAAAIGFAAQYGADAVFDMYWRPFLDTLEPPQPPADKPLMDQVAVMVPAMRPNSVEAFMEAFNRSNDGTATAYFIADPDNDPLIAAVRLTDAILLISDRGHTFAQKANYGYSHTREDWIFVTGEDTEPTPGWIGAARKLSDRYDVIGTNDTDGQVKNPDVAAKRHADHWFTRRAYIDDIGSSLEGPGVFCPEAYNHWYVDKEVVGLARNRGVFAPCLESVVIHHHPGYDGDEQARRTDPVYMAAVEHQEHDRTQFARRVALIEQQRITRGR